MGGPTQWTLGTFGAVGGQRCEDLRRLEFGHRHGNGSIQDIWMDNFKGGLHSMAIFPKWKFWLSRWSTDSWMVRNQLA